MEIAQEAKKEPKVVGQLTDEQLAKISGMNQEYTKLKIALGDLELNKHSVIKQIDILRAKFLENEKAITKRYGKNSVIDLRTGVVKDGN